MSTLAIVTAIPEELPDSGNLSETVFFNLPKTKIDRYVLLIADLEGSSKLAQWAEENSIDYLIGDADSVIDRIDKAIKKYDPDILIRLMLRACWMDVELVDETIDCLIDTESDYVEYALNINYAMGADCFTKEAFFRAKKNINEILELSESSPYLLSPWALFEEDKSFKKHTMNYYKVYEKERVESLRAKLDGIFGHKQNHLSSSFDKPAARYIKIRSLMKSDQNVAEIACGQGGGSAYLSEICKTFDAYDISEEYIMNAQKIYKEYPINFIHGGEEELMKKASFYDAIVSLHTLEHVPNEDSFLESVFKSLKPGGYFFCEVPRLLEIPLQKPLFPFHEKEYSLEDLTYICLKAGFIIKDAFGVSRNVYTRVTRAREAYLLVLQKQ